MRASRVLRATIGLGCLAVATTAGAEDWATRSNINLRPGVTELSHDIYGLHMYVLWVCAALGLLVVGLMLYSVIRHRRSVRPTPSTFHEKTSLEIFWTIVPILILVSMAVPASTLMAKIDNTANADLTVRVTGHRWHWEYEYLTYNDQGNLGVDIQSKIATPQDVRYNPIFASGLFPYGTAKDLAGKPAPPKKHNYNLTVDHPLILPSGQKIRFLITSADVIHSFWVPDFGGKQDAIPGYVHAKWTKIPPASEGTYYGQCTELCGKGHAFMPIEVKVVSQQEFKGWLDKRVEEAKAAPDLTPFSGMDEAMKTGEKVFTANCAVCHGAQGEGGIGVPMAGNDFFTDSSHVEEHIETVLNGKNAMPSFKSQLSPTEIAAVITYERNAWGNDSGDLIQPADVNKDE